MREELIDKAPKLLVITGPTATGKTALGIMLAKEFGGEVVSADSCQVYIGMDIGSAKPSAEEMDGVIHHMLDVVLPSSRYSVSRYVEDATACVEGILARGNLPIIVGGSGLYIDSLVAGREFADTEGNLAIRRGLEERYKTLGGETLLEELRVFDPLRAEKLSSRDMKRIVRAHEIFLLTGKSMTEHDEETKKLPPRYEAATIALNFKSREDLYRRIDTRVDIMLAQGLIREVETLLSSGLTGAEPSLRAIGYRQVVPYLRGEISLESAIEAIKRESRRYAKRQLTWLNGSKNVHWIMFDREPDYYFARQNATDFMLNSSLI